jgi:transposase
MLQLITILNRCHRFPGFVYHQSRFSSDRRSIEIAVRPRKRSVAVCSRCHQPGRGYDQLPERRFEFIPFWGFLVFLLYSMRRVDCRHCQAVVVEEVPWGDGKRTLTRAYMLFLARWARKLSWKETAESFRTSWEKVFDAVEYVVTFGLEHRVLGQIDAIGVDEIQYARGHKFQQLCDYNSVTWAARFLDEWCRQVMRSRIEPMKKIARSLRHHRELILNYFRAQKTLSSGVVEGLNNKAKVTMRKSYGFRTFRCLELALYHSLGKLPEPESTHEFF